jgi:hypothetical protein
MTTLFIYPLAAFVVFIGSIYAAKRQRQNRWRLGLERGAPVRFYYAGEWQIGKVSAFYNNGNTVAVRYAQHQQLIFLPLSSLVPLEQDYTPFLEKLNFKSK